MNIARNTARVLGAAIIGSTVLLTACVVEPRAPETQPALASAPTSESCDGCGTITAVRSVSANDYRVTLRMDDGGVRTINLNQQPAFQVGDHVQLLRSEAYHRDD